MDQQKLSVNILGRTGLRVTNLGLGCGGPSRLGLKHGATRDDAVRVIHHAIDRGINLLDTAQAYTTEPDIARAIAESGRDGVAVSTKATINVPGKSEIISAAELASRLERSLQALRTDRLDIFYLHGVEPSQYRMAAESLAPEMLRQQERGKVRFIGVTEDFNTDFRHEMISQAIEHDCWDVMMVGFNYLNHTARDLVLPKLREKNIGTIGMFAVRRALADPERFRLRLTQLIEQNKIDRDILDVDDPMGFALGEGKATSLADLAYRYAMYEPGLHAVLVGTGSVHHLDENIESARRGPLPRDVTEKLDAIFARVDCAAGN